MSGFTRGLREGLGLGRERKERLAERKSRERIASGKLARDRFKDLSKQIGETARGVEDEIDSLRSRKSAIERQLASGTFAGDATAAEIELESLTSDITRKSKGAGSIRGSVPGISGLPPQEQDFFSQNFLGLTEGSFTTNEIFRAHMDSITKGLSPSAKKLAESFLFSGVRSGRIQIIEDDPSLIAATSEITEDETTEIFKLLDTRQIRP